MATYKIYVDYSASIAMKVNANSKQEARKKAVLKARQPEWLEEAAHDLTTMSVYTEDEI